MDDVGAAARQLEEDTTSTSGPSDTSRLGYNIRRYAIRKIHSYASAQTTACVRTSALRTGL